MNNGQNYFFGDDLLYFTTGNYAYFTHYLTRGEYYVLLQDIVNKAMLKMSNDLGTDDENVLEMYYTEVFDLIKVYKKYLNEEHLFEFLYTHIFY